MNVYFPFHYSVFLLVELHCQARASNTQTFSHIYKGDRQEILSKDVGPCVHFSLTSILGY